MIESIDHNPKVRRRAMLAIALLLAVFAALSYSAISRKNATVDEPLHALGGYLRLFKGDFRVNVEDPPLFSYFAMVPQLAAKPLVLNMTDPSFERILSYMWSQWIWIDQTLYLTPGNDPETFIKRARPMMLLVGVALGAAIAFWSWKLAGPHAAVVATFVYAFDPNLAGHAPLVKNDVSITLAFFVTTALVWSIGRHVRAWNAASLALMCGIAVNTKFSGVLVAPLVVGLLLARALARREWWVVGLRVDLILPKLAVAAALSIGCLAASVLITWATYDFRYAPTPDPAQRLNVPVIVDAAAVSKSNAYQETHGKPPDAVTAARFAETPLIRFVTFADESRLLPQAWLAGLLDTYATTIYRKCYLNGAISNTGWWYYFPLAMLYKTPTGTILLALFAIVVFSVRRSLRVDLASASADVECCVPRWWTAFCVAAPPVAYLAIAMSGNLNLGIRHVFPVYPFIYVLIGAAIGPAIAKAWTNRSLALPCLAGVMLLALATETLCAWPDYIAFFNQVFGGGTRGGIAHLGDSNLDWGQDLATLRRWQRAHPDTKLYLAYFGGEQPERFVNADPLPGNATYFKPPEWPSAPGVAAVSATHLQGIYLDPPTAAVYRDWLKHKTPIDVLGGSIYLYRVGDKESDSIR